MKLNLARRVGLARGFLAAAVLLMLWANVSAQTYPAKPIRLLVPYPAGGATDTFARGVAQKLSEYLGQAVIVENRGGANGLIGLQAAARAPADGYTLFMTATSIDAIGPPLFKEAMPVDPATSLSPVAFVASIPNVLVVNPGLSAGSVAELVAYLRREPSANFGSFGVSTTTRVGWVQFEQAAGFNVPHIPYKGDAQMMVDLVGNTVQVSMPTVIAAAPFVRDGRLRALAVTSATRSSALPDVPTIAEAGYPNCEASTWFGIVAPKGTPDGIVQTLNTEINRAMGTPEMQERLRTVGASTTAMSVAAFEDFLTQERKRWTQVVESSGIKPE